MAGPRKIKKGELLFREGDDSHAMFVIRSGKIAITKNKGTSEIILAELNAGDMLGEMAFFDNKPRSAGARAVIDTEIIELPFASLNAQFKTFPEWLKAIMRTVNTHLRNANQKIKNLERTAEEEKEIFPAHMVNRLIAVLAFVAHKYGEKSELGLSVSGNLLRNHTIQIFQAPTNKMQTMVELLQSYQYAKYEDLGEGNSRITVLNLDFLFSFVNWHNNYTYTEESKRTTILEKEMKPIQALIHYGKKETPDAKGFTKVSLTNIQRDCLKDLGFPMAVADFLSLNEKKLTAQPVSDSDGQITLTFTLSELQKIFPFWEIVFATRKYTMK